MTLDTIFPRDQWEHTSVSAETPLIDGCVPMFRLKGSKLRVIVMPGLAPGTRTVIGFHVLFRAGDDSMNMHVECSNDMTMLNATVKTAVQMSGDRAITHRKFIDNFVRWHDEKSANGHSRRLVIDPHAPPDATPSSSASTSEPVVVQTSSETSAQQASAKVQARTEKPDDAQSSKRARVDAAPEECSVCMSAPADTLAVPCGHSVVCAACSRLLAAQVNSTNQKHCVVCRALITHVAYPDNTVVPIR